MNECEEGKEEEPGEDLMHSINISIRKARFKEISAENCEIPAVILET